MKRPQPSLHLAETITNRWVAVLMLPQEHGYGSPDSMLISVIRQSALLRRLGAPGPKGGTIDVNLAGEKGFSDLRNGGLRICFTFETFPADTPVARATSIRTSSLSASANCVDPCLYRRSSGSTSHVLETAAPIKGHQDACEVSYAFGTRFSLGGEAMLLLDPCGGRCRSGSHDSGSWRGAKRRSLRQ